MKVILLKELPGRGGEGDVIEVANGYANNYLLTHGFAVKATKGNLKSLEERKNSIARREETRIANANSLKETLEKAKIKVYAQVGEEGQLFGSVTSMMIADAVKSSLGVEVDRRRIELGKPIRTVGPHTVVVDLYRDIKATLEIEVLSQEEQIANDLEAIEDIEEAIDVATTPEIDAVSLEVEETETHIS
ncbi:MAG: 50S ribosomal protein L9 [Eggerthellaceae bacterium]|nr:50S ribosomal protein L9 [Eggerthellaceae bacterium]